MIRHPDVLSQNTQRNDESLLLNYTKKFTRQIEKIVYSNKSHNFDYASAFLVLTITMNFISGRDRNHLCRNEYFQRILDEKVG